MKTPQQASAAKSRIDSAGLKSRLKPRPTKICQFSHRLCRPWSLTLLALDSSVTSLQIFIGKRGLPALPYAHHEKPYLDLHSSS